MANTPEGTPYVESSDLVANYPAASLALANRVDLVGVLPFADSAARTTAISSPADGQYSYLQDTNATEFWNGSAWVAAGGKILQIVRATDTTDRSTTSTSFVDVTGMSVTITPQKSTSAVLLVAYFSGQLSTTGFKSGFYQITDSSNNAISGASNNQIYSDSEIITPMSLLAYATPATTSAVTHKLRFRVDQAGATNQLRNSSNSVGQLYAIEVSA